MPVSGSTSLYALPPRWGRRSRTSTSRPSSLAHRSAMVRPKNPEPTTTRSGLDKVRTPDRSWPASLARGGLRTWNRAHAAGAAHGTDHVARLGPAAPERAQRDHRCRDGVGLRADQRVRAVAEVHREQVAVHVVALPARQVVLLAEVQLAHQHRVAQRPDAVAGAPGPEGEVDVVVEDEERRVRDADRVDDLAAEQEPLEGDVLQLDAAWHSVPV